MGTIFEPPFFESTSSIERSAQQMQGSMAAKGSELGHGPCGAQQARGMAPPPATAPLDVPALRADIGPALFLAAPRPLFAWTSAQPRAPPLAS